MLKARSLRALHAIIVASVVCGAVYLYVPRFAPVFANFELPLSSRVLMAGYQFAFILPVVAAAAALLPSPSSPRLRYVVPGAYVIGLAILVFIVWATYAPVFAHSEGK
jgi:hypothetical protein